MPTVLYVDDDPAVRMVVRRQLEYNGLQVYTAEGVREAKERIEQMPPDGLFIDIWLGDGTAFELHAWLQEHHPDAVEARRVRERRRSWRHDRPDADGARLSGARQAARRAGNGAARARVGWIESPSGGSGTARQPERRRAGARHRRSAHRLHHSNDSPRPPLPSTVGWRRSPTRVRDTIVRSRVVANCRRGRIRAATASRCFATGRRRSRDARAHRRPPSGR